MKQAEKGSITVYMALSLAVMVTLIMGAIKAVKVQAGRAQAANGADQALYSLLAHYDRKTFEKFGIFCVNAENGGGLDLGAVNRQLEEDISYILTPNKGRISGAKNLIKLKNESTALTGYTLLTDAGGRPFEEQAVQCMKDTQAITAVSKLQRLMQQSEHTENTGNSLLAASSSASYADVQAAAASAAEAAAAEDAPETVPAEVPDDFENPLPALEALKGMSLLDLVAPNGISEKIAENGVLTGGSPGRSGVGVISADGNAGSGSGRLFYIEYILEHFGTYSNPSEAALSYQQEYILFGKKSDRDNLKAAVRRILLMREGINITFLYTNPSKSAELDSAAMLIAAALLIPEAQPLVKVLLAAGWAFAESVVDVRALLEGKRVQLVKTADGWQTDFRSLAHISSNIGSLTKDAAGGLEYEDYLGMLFLAGGKPSTARTLDMFQAEMRIAGDGYGAFRTDCCMDSISAEFQVRAENIKTFSVEQTMCYRKM